MFSKSVERIKRLWTRARLVARASRGDRHLLELVARASRDDRRLLTQVVAVGRGYASSEHWPWLNRATEEPTHHANPLRAFFEARTVGRGIWKWDHYFDIYDRHFHRFRGREVHILEIGVYSGGSLEMWRDYFGPRCQVYAVDIEPACKAYEGDSVRVFIGNQGDPGFWKRFRNDVPTLDIVVDDGSHVPEHQILTLEGLLPHLQPGGVYLCEDVHGAFNGFASYVQGLAHRLNAEQLVDNLDNNERRLTCKTEALQAAVGSIHLYPFVTVVERTDAPITEFVAPKHGTQWAPFLQ